jgi:hypothetical protein
MIAILLAGCWLGVVVNLHLADTGKRSPLDQRIRLYGEIVPRRSQSSPVEVGKATRGI